MTFGVSHSGRMTINNQVIFGDIAASSDAIALAFQRPDGLGGQVLDNAITTFPRWNTQTMIVSPNVLRERNVLRIEAGQSDDGNVDNFIIDNVSLIYKTRTTGIGTLPG